MPSEGGNVLSDGISGGGCRISRRAPLRCFPTYPICSEHIYEKEKNTAPGNLFGGFVCLYGDGGTPTQGK
ncbi:hypothetical protein [Neisseria blantyrii]|uniref:hypothetical protein n=1 Tax=Neisseria blantyrii TaxID=2830647 RepID=UPI002657C7D8|nr:hypothetical protein [Neisseria blantyrii]